MVYVVMGATADSLKGLAATPAIPERDRGSEGLGSVEARGSTRRP